MLSKDHRLTDKKDFDLVKDKGKVFRFNYFTLLVRPRADKGPTRFGFIVSKKVSPLAVTRNKVKRGLGEGVRQNMIYIKPGLDCIVVAHPESARAYSSDLMQKISVAIDKSKIAK
jgi:ribonuclease P protein component